MQVVAADVSYSIKPSQSGAHSRPKQSSRAVLKHLSFTLEPGTLTYIIGPSGAGKTATLSIISGRIPADAIQGAVAYSNGTACPQIYADIAYAQQSPHQIPALTVGETLHFTASLRFHCSAERERRIAAVVDTFQLRGCYDTLVGGDTERGLSSGEAKRLSVAVEVMHEPGLILLDEPTSGLDAAMAHKMAEAASRTAQRGSTVAATLHQPSVEMLGFATSVLLLAHGWLVYSGPPSGLIDHFSSPRMGFAAHSLFPNPAEFAIAVVSGRLQSSVVDVRRTHELAERLAKVGVQSPGPERVAVDENACKPNVEKRHQPHNRYATSWGEQVWALLWRFWLLLRRDSAFVWGRFFKEVAACLGAGAVYCGQGRLRVTLNTSYNVSSLCYTLTMYAIMTPEDMIPVLHANFALYDRERLSGLYSPSAMWVAQALVYLPLLLVSNFTAFQLISFISGVWGTLQENVYAYSVGFLTSLTSFYVAMLLTALTRDAEAAFLLHVTHVFLVMPLVGFEVPIPQLPKWLQLVSPLAYARWGYHGLMHGAFQHRPDRQGVFRVFGVGGYAKEVSVAVLCVSAALVSFAVYVAMVSTRKRGARGAHKVSDDCLATAKEQPSSAAQDHNGLPPQTTRCESPGPSEEGVERVPSSEQNPCTLLFKDLKFSIRASGTVDKPILRGISGLVRRGEICAIMGSSGAGKSTLLDVLAHSTTCGQVSGDYRIAGEPSPPGPRWRSYVTQDYAHTPVFTVWETLKYAALLRLDTGMSRRGCELRAREVMRLLRLDDVANVLVGSKTHKGISGGEARRLTIAVEMMHLCPVLFLDEPTTGLDSSMAYEVMTALRGVANRGYTVVCSVHAPTERIFNMLDSLIILADGYQTYFGSACKARARHLLPERQDQDVRGGLIEAELSKTQGNDISTGFVLEESARGQHEAFLGSSDYLQTCRTWATTAYHTSSVQASKGAPVHKKPLLQVGRCLQAARVLAERRVLKMWRMRSFLSMLVLRNIFRALINGLVRQNLRRNHILPRLSLLIHAVTSMFVSHLSLLPSFFEERLIYYQETRAGIYGAGSEWLASVLPLLPISIINVFTYGPIVYFTSKLRGDAWHFVMHMVVLFIISVYGLVVCRLISYVTPTAQTATSVFLLLLAVFSLLSGFVVRLPTLPSVLGVWSSALSFFRWAWEALVLYEFEGNERITGYKLFRTQDTHKAYIRHKKDAYKVFLDVLGFLGHDKHDILVTLVVHVVAVYGLSYLAVRLVRFDRRVS